MVDGDGLRRVARSVGVRRKSPTDNVRVSKFNSLTLFKASGQLHPRTLSVKREYGVDDKV